MALTGHRNYAMMISTDIHAFYTLGLSDGLYIYIYAYVHDTRQQLSNGLATV